MEAIILKISWHYWRVKMRNNSKIKNVEKKYIYMYISIISNNKNNNYNSNNNDLKDGQNHRLGKKFEFE